MHFFHTKMYQSIKLILKPVKIFKTLQHVSVSYEIILREFVNSLFPWQLNKLKLSNLNKEITNSLRMIS